MPSAARRAAPPPPGSAACSTRGCSPSSSRRPVRCSTRRRVCHSRGWQACRCGAVDQRHDPLPDHPAVPAREARLLAPRPGHLRDLEPHPRGRHRLRTRRSQQAAALVAPTVAGAEGPFSVHTAKNGTELPGELVRSAGDPASGDVTVDEAYAGVEALAGDVRGGLRPRRPTTARARRWSRRCTTSGTTTTRSGTAPSWSSATATARCSAGSPSRSTCWATSSPTPSPSTPPT